MRERQNLRTNWETRKDSAGWLAGWLAFSSLTELSTLWWNHKVVTLCGCNEERLWVSVSCQKKVSPIVDETHYPKTSAEYIPSLQMCGQHVASWAWDVENWGAPRGALNARADTHSNEEWGREGSFIPIQKFKKNEWLCRHHSQIWKIFS